MTDEVAYLPDDTLWEEEEVPVESSGITRFAKAKLFYPLYINRFQAGQHFTLPGVYYDEYDEATQSSNRVGLKEFRGSTLGNKKSKFYMALMVLELQDKNKNWYQRQIQFGNWKDKDSSGCAWVDFQKDELLKLSMPDRAVLTAAAKNNEWAFIQYTEQPTGYTGEFEIKKYLADIKVYKSEAEWRKASEDHFAQFNGNGAAAEPATNCYPMIWGKDAQIMLDYAKGDKIKEDFAEKNLDFSDDKVLAEHLQLTLDGVPANMADGNPCDVRKIMADIRSCPEALVKL